ncbi:MAG: hypothetical protein EOO27_47540 [Comamonadaceae bacterium]|nr:MAG: hypothetical protein EOO27_47540 [Comamonadaceae bacterium]
MTDPNDIPDQTGLKGDLSAIVASQVAGETLERTATRAGVSVATVQRRLADPAVRKMIREHRDSRLGSLLDRQAELAMKSAARLGALVEHEDPSIALRAISLAFTNTARLTSAVDVAARLADIEDQLEAGQ